MDVLRMPPLPAPPGLAGSRRTRRRAVLRRRSCGRLRVVKEYLVEKCLEMFAEVAEKKEEYRRLYEKFGKCLKLGVDVGPAYRNKIAELLRFHTSKYSDEQISLKEYVGRMKEGQNDIFYITGESIAAVSASPSLEFFRKGGLEVLYLLDPVDEGVMQLLKEFEGKKLTSTAEYGWSGNKEFNVEAQALSDNGTTPSMVTKKTMEVNPKHSIVTVLTPEEDATPEASVAGPWRPRTSWTPTERPSGSSPVHADPAASCTTCPPGARTRASCAASGSKQTPLAAAKTDGLSTAPSAAVLPSSEYDDRMDEELSSMSGCDSPPPWTLFASAWDLLRVKCCSRGSHDAVTELTTAVWETNTHSVDFSDAPLFPFECT